jgi:hypothetical protein
MSFISGGILNTKGQYNKSLKLNACRRDFRPHFASKDFGKLSDLAGPASA